MALALPAVAIALVGLLIAFAFFPLVRPPLNAIVSAVPLIGGTLANAMDGAIWWAYSQSINVAAAAIRGAGEIFSVPTMMQHWLTDNVGAAAASAAMAAWRISHITIPLIVSQLTSLAYWARDAAIAVALQVEHDVAGLAWTLYGMAIAHADQWGINLEGLAWTLHSMAIAHADEWGINLEGLIWAVHGLEVQYVDGAIAAVVARQDVLYADAIGYADKMAQEAERYAEGIDAQTRQWAAGELGAVERYAEGLNAATLAQALAASGAVARELAQLEERDCIKFCNPLGGLGSLLQDLEDAGMLALLLALLGETVNDPAAVLGDVSSVVAPIVQEIGQGVSELAGIGSRAA